MICLNKKYYIGDIRIAVNSYKDKYFEDFLSPYLSDFKEPAEVCINVSKSDIDITPDYHNLVRLGENRYYCVVDGCDAVIFHDKILGKIIALMVFNDDYSKVDITAYNLKDNHNVSDLTFVHNLVGNAMRYVVMMHSGFVFHSSSIGCLDGGVVFSAKSGTGKSTHTGLWLSVFDDTEILNDDAPIIRKNASGEIMLYGTPWAGSTGININKSVPLKAIVFLSRAKENTIERIAPSKAFGLFYEGIASPLNSKMNMRVLDTLNSVFSAVPIYSLACNMEPEAAVIARNEIFKQT